MLLRAMPKWADGKFCIELADALIDKANTLWKMSIDDHSQFKISHDVYLKYWALTDPDISAKFILFDEAQDADPVMLDILNKQSAQIIYVGDRHRETALHCLYLINSFLAIDFILKELSFFEPLERVKQITEGFMYGDRGRVGMKKY